MSWNRIKGHDDRIRLFQQAHGRGRLGHAYLFAGPPGVGKRLFAGELGRALLCEGRPEDRLEACDRCPSCIQVDAGSHPDFYTVGLPEESLEIPIDSIREVGRSFALKSARGRGKVAILDQADDLNDAAANCFLKTLEEPPPGSVLILIGSSPDRQLATIVSRCQVVRFPPLPAEVVGKLLRASGIEDQGLLERLVRMSDGSPGQGLALADPALWQFRGALLESLARPRPDSVALAQQWTRFVEEAGKESAQQRRRASLVLRLLIDFLNDVVRVRLGSPPRSRDDLAILQQLASRLDPERVIEILDRCLEADMHIDRRVQLVLILEGLMDAVAQRVSAS